MQLPTTVEECAALLLELQKHDAWREPYAYALGMATVTDDGDVLDVNFLDHINLKENNGVAALMMLEVTGFIGTGGIFLSNWDIAYALEVLSVYEGDGKSHQNIDVLKALQSYLSCERSKTPQHDVMPIMVTIMSPDEPPVDAADVYLRLNMLSLRKAQPHDLNLEGMFGLLHNVAWTDHGPIKADLIKDVRRELFARGEKLKVSSIDKFPRMTDYVVPSGVRIADADRVRLGAHLAEGTTVMHEGFVNFNAGTLGASMVEGRISAGVVVGDGSDIGGGASIMGTLSGGGKEVISIGEGCLLGANSGIGISLGDNCVVAAGCYVTAGSKVKVLGSDGRQFIMKASKLSGASNVLFLCNSQTGTIEARPREGKGIVLNEVLHAN